MLKKTITMVLFCVAVLFLSGCHRLHKSTLPECNMKDLIYEPGSLPSFTDDLGPKSLEKSLNKSIDFLEKLPPDSRVEACGEKYNAEFFLASLVEFKRLVREHSSDELNGIIADKFRVCQVQNSAGGEEIMVTGYYQPLLKGSRERQGEYVYPLYSVPPDLIKATEYTDKGRVKVGRIENGRLVPYWSRSDIESRGVIAGSEILYLADPFDAFTLHVQGSGIVELLDGSVIHVLFAESNGLPYVSIGKLLVDEGRVPLEEITMPRIKQYLSEHPEEQQRILHANERFIFFRLAEGGMEQGPVGSMGQELTAERSVALDPDCFPIGGLYFLESEKPEFENDSLLRWGKFSRFVLHQDSGSAIKGSGRLDYFWGSGKFAENAAGLMKNPGKLFMLIKK